MCYCQLHNLFYCYGNFATANFTICSTATITALLRYCQLHNLFYCNNNCATVLLLTSQFVLLMMCHCATARLPSSQIYLTALLHDYQLHKFILQRYCATATSQTYLTALLLTSHTPNTHHNLHVQRVIIGGC